MCNSPNNLLLALVLKSQKTKDPLIEAQLEAKKKQLLASNKDAAKSILLRLQYELDSKVDRIERTCKR